MKYISFAIPCYNSQDYMAHAIESILPGGEYVEIIIVNDGSKDRTSEIAHDYMEKYPTIVKVVDKENGGHGDAVNSGLTYATGKYFKVVDSDDWVDEDALHGTVYLKCENAPCNVYFDAENLNVGSDAQSLAAMRLGIRITSNSGTNTYLFLLDELGAVAGAQSRATIPASSAVVSSISSGGQAAYVSDPSTSISQYMAYKNSSDKYDAGASVLVSLETDEVASVEYWLYLEGCDEQCFNPVQNKDAGLMLAFVGVDESQKGGAK